jgi:hypothetical protein
VSPCRSLVSHAVPSLTLQAMRSVHFSEPDDEPIRGGARARPQPRTRSKVSRGEGASDATTGRVTPALPSEFSSAGDSDHHGDADDHDDTSIVAFDAQGVTLAELDKNVKVDCCAICGAGHFSPTCKARTYHELRNRPHAEQRPVIPYMRDRSARTTTKDLYISAVDGDKRVCKELNVYGKCEKNCSRPHTCSLCAQSGHGARFCPTYRAELLGQARDKILASRRQQSAPPSSIPNRPPVAPVIPTKWYTVTVAAPPSSKLEPRFPGPSSYGCTVRGDDGVESWPRSGDEGYPGPPEEGVLELLARHRLTDADFAEFAGTAHPRSNDKLVYPAAPQVYLRPDVRLYLELADFVNAAGDHDGTRVSNIIANAGVEPTQQEYKLARQRYRSGAEANNKHALTLEKLACDKSRREPYFPSHFKIDGLNDKSRMQVGDGARSVANAHLVFHYPSAHLDSRQLTPQAFATNLVRGYQLIPPGETGGLRNLASYNRYPVKCMVVEEGGPRVRKLNGENLARPYPHEIKKHYDSDLFHFYSNSVQDQRSHLVVLFGAAAKDLCDEVESLLKADNVRFQRHDFEVKVPSLADWEMGIDSAELSALREESERESRTWLSDDELFGMHAGLASDERKRPSAIRAEVEIGCTLFNRAGSPDDTGVLFIRAPHPQNANLLVSPAKEVQELDFVLDFFSAAVRNTLGTVHRPRPTFAFSTHHAQLKFEQTANIPAKTRTGLSLLNYGPSQVGTHLLAERLYTVQQNLHFGPQKAVFSLASLPLSLRKLAGRATVAEALSVDPAQPPPYTYLGFEQDVVQHVRFVLSRDIGVAGSTAAAAAAQARRQAGVSLPRSAAQATQSQAAVAAANAASLATSPHIKTGDEYDSVCQCGIVSKSNQYDKATGRPLAKLVMFTPQGRHPPNASRQDHGSCWTGIPVRDDLRHRLMLHKSRGNFDPSAQDKTNIIGAAIARHRSGQPPPAALNAQELAAWDAARRAKIMTRKQSAAPTQASPASTNPTGQARLSISSTGAVSAQPVPHAESSAAQQ